MQFQLNTLTLINFMGFEKEVFNFSEQLTVIVGPNGSGKSAILEALALSFQIKERGNAVNMYIHKNAETAQVELKGFWMNKPLEIVSVFARKGRKITRKISYNGELLENTVANNFLTEYFNEKNLIISFALQGNERFLSNSKMQNFKNFMELLQIDFSKETDIVKNQIKDLKKEIELENIKLHTKEGALQYIDSQISQVESSLNQLKEIIAPNQDEYKTLEQSIESNSLQLKNLQDQKQKAVQIQNSIKELNDSISMDEYALQKLQEELKNIHIPETQHCESIQEEFIQKKSRYEQLQKQLEELTVHKINLNSKLNLELKRKDQIHSGTCPVCLQQVTTQTLQSNNTEISTLQSEINQIDKSSSILDIDKKGIGTEIDNLKKKIQTIEQLNNQIPWMQKNKQSLQQNESLLINKLKQNQERLVSLQNQIVSVDVTRIESLESNLKKLKEKKATLDNKNKSYIEFVSRKKELTCSLQDLRQKKLQEEDQKIQHDTYIKDLEKKLQQYMHIQQAFETVPKLHTQKMINELESMIDTSIKSFGYKGARIEMDENGIDFYLGKQSENFQLEIPYHMCSSFQKNLINISCILAFSIVFNIPFICIDELDANADKHNTLKLTPLIKNMLLKAPVVTVTHSESLASELLKSTEKVHIIQLNKDLVKTYEETSA